MISEITLKEFGANLIVELEKLNSNFKYSINDYYKNNKKVISLCVDYYPGSTNSLSARPMFHLDSFYGTDNISEIAKEVYDFILNYKKETEELNSKLKFDYSKDYETLKDKIFVKIISLDKNKDFLKTLIYREYAGVAVVPYICFDISEDKRITSNISKVVFESFENKPTEDELFETALFNTKKKEYVFNFMIDYIYSEKLIKFSPVKFLQFFNENGSKFNDELMYPIIFTNSENHYGAAFVLFKEYINVIANILDSNLYILPSSIEDVLIFPENRISISEENLIKLVKEVNSDASVIKDTDILDDFIWHYDKNTMELTYIST